MKRFLLIAVVASLLLSGCAARVKQGGSQDLRLQESAKANLVVTFVGNRQVEANADWYLLKGAWSQALSADAAAEGYVTSFLGGQPKTQPHDGVMVVIHVSNFRYIQWKSRFWASFTTGNAWVNARVEFRDLRSGQLLGTRTYDSYSLGWQMWFSAMTEKQLRKISRLMIADIKAAAS
ncbi:hypothetical protein Q1J52_07300 [Pseudomonas lijiangensis]|uniref:hypothetical protein n=1 Tax=Pseudomonas lijiangensis TaxID=2995658 RepID=UPI0034D612BB